MTDEIEDERGDEIRPGHRSHVAQGWARFRREVRAQRSAMPALKL